MYSTLGDPDFEEFDYFEGIDRYRQKFQMYTDLGVFKSKEVLPEAMIFFHDYSIKLHLNDFENAFFDYASTKTIVNRRDVYQYPEVNAIFSWWMKALGNKIKHKIELLNSNTLSNDIRKVDFEIEDTRREAQELINNANASDLKKLYTTWTKKLIDAMSMNTLYQYITALNNEITAYSQDQYFATPEEDIEKKDELVEKINEALNSYL
jgi:hypothetical protein